LKARTGELTPPGRSASAFENSASLAVVRESGAVVFTAVSNADL
jgi:hypothetical protein